MQLTNNGLLFWLALEEAADTAVVEFAGAACEAFAVETPIDGAVAPEVLAILSPLPS